MLRRPLGSLLLSAILAGGCATPEERARQAIVAGSEALRGGDGETAVARFTEATELAPDLATGWARLAEAQLAAERWSEALAAYERATEAGADGARARLALARLRLDRGELDEAARQLDLVAATEGLAEEQREALDGLRARVTAAREANAASRYAIAGPRDNPDPHLARAEALAQAQQSGILAILASSSPGSASPFGRDAALGTGTGDTLGSLMGDQIGDSFGSGGLGLRGSGPGGAGTGEGTIGLGSIGTIGHGAGPGSTVGYGGGSGGLRLPGPTVRFGPVTATGGDVEVARRVLGRQSLAFRGCYERELARTPGLAGALTLRLVTDATGRTTDATVTSSTLPSNDAGTCIARSARSARFPAPEGGGWTVTLPLTLAPGE